VLKQEAINVVRLTVYLRVLGAILLVITANFIEKSQIISIESWMIIIWLGLVNTAFTFLIWNPASRKIRVFQQTILQNTMLIQIALLSYVFLGEILIINKIFGILLVFAGILVVQYFEQYIKQKIRLLNFFCAVIAVYTAIFLHMLIQVFVHSTKKI